MIVYIAGPITGVMNYREKFMAAQKKLEDMGHIVINPAYLPSGLKDYMPICKRMIDQADVVYFLEGWVSSVGAKEELHYAKNRKKQIEYQRPETIFAPPRHSFAGSGYRDAASLFYGTPADRDIARVGGLWT